MFLSAALLEFALQEPIFRMIPRTLFRKILAPIEIKSALPPPKTQNTPPPKKAEFYGHGGFPAERTHFPGVHKIGAAISGPRIADKNYFTDTRLFLICPLSDRSGCLRVRLEERLGKLMGLDSEPFLDTNRESQQYSGTALGCLRVRLEERLGKPMGLFSEPFLKPIGAANSTRGQP